MRGKLLSEDFLETGIWETQEGQQLDDDNIAELKANLSDIFSDISLNANLNESVTEDKIIIPVLKALGWPGYLTQQTASEKGRFDVPDILLLPDEDSEKKAFNEKKDDKRYKWGVSFVESKRWNRPLDRKDKSESFDPGAPSTQMLRYLSRISVITDESIQWGILTNGRLWRLYWQGARSRAEQFLEIDLAQALQFKEFQSSLLMEEYERPENLIKIFYLIFNPSSFQPSPTDPEARTFHKIAVDEGKLWEQKVSKELGEVVFNEVFPDLVKALIGYDKNASSDLNDQYLQTVNENATTWLYRMLFIFYAEDRNLLPVTDKSYDDYSLRHIRNEIAERMDKADVFSEAASKYDSHLKDLFNALSKGDSSIGVPPYNGGLFEEESQPLLEKVKLPDKVLAPLIDKLSRREKEGKKVYINYHDLSVQQLGSIYEMLLEYSPFLNEKGEITIMPNIFARKGSGSYYTHDTLVKLIIEKAVEPLVEEKYQSFQNKSKSLKRSRKNKKEKIEELKKYDPASEILKLKICDPAIGSGHFLVNLVDFLADQVLEKMSEAQSEVTWANENEIYSSPLEERIESIRQTILQKAKKEKWNIDPEKLDDRHIVRRMILKRVIYGVDKNCMAVELAKVALWLHTFTVGAPLSFLDHHLRAGDSLFGEWMRNMDMEMREIGSLFQFQMANKLEVAANSMNKIAEMTDTDVSEVKLSKELFEETEKTIEPIKKLMDFWHALKWLDKKYVKGKSLLKAHPGIQPLLNGQFGNIADVVMEGEVEASNDNESQAVKYVNDLLNKTMAIAQREKFFHWQIAFPTVWTNITSPEPKGGFDAIIGNPPWDRMKLQQVEWFSQRKPEIANQSRASDRKEMIKKLEKKKDPLWEIYQDASGRSEISMNVARKSGEYPLLSKGDINIYSLFVERAGKLIKKDGIVGVLTPSGIAGDLSASEFFKSIATTGRLGALLDFENKKVFFPDIDSRFKFCVLVFGGPERSFETATCAFFLHSIDELEDEDRTFNMSAKTFKEVNPNTGTAPIFRRKRDAEITTKIYDNFPVFMDKNDLDARPEHGYKKVWPVKYCTMFHMTNDSHLFKTKPELEKEGFYPVEGNLWKKGEVVFVPLYVGRMIYHYDHRAASVKVNEQNLQNPSLSESVSAEKKMDPGFVPTPQYWVNRSEIEENNKFDWTLAFRDVTNPTNERTVIASIVNFYALGNTLPFLYPEEELLSFDEYKNNIPLILSNLNSFVLDYMARQKVQGQHLNWYIVEQLPFIPKEKFDNKIGGQSIKQFITDSVVKLSYTAHDLSEFAEDMGHKGGPYIWDEEDRLHTRCRLDALFFLLYGLDKDEASYVMDQFPIVKKDDEKAYGFYRTRDMILAYMNALSAGDTETKIDM